ncbi:MAG: patatin-like phospholipase family protein [Cyanobacteriota bacterium]|nr:patatin-like phospholipase family protein [Cyanobacteriota bacterium]
MDSLTSHDDPILARIRQPGPKKILACDGGGIRGLISLGILAKLEAELRQASQQPNLLLGDYFDFICGTSTGGIIAACLSSGMSVSQVLEFYKLNGTSMFQREKWYRQLHEKYVAEPLAGLLKKVFNSQLNGPGYQYDESHAPVELGDQRLKGLLMLMMRNHNTDSPWPVCNNPLAKYNQRSRPDCNLQLPLWQLVRASTAAPTFFPPEVVTFAEGTDHEYKFIFVDGGVTTYNNPAYMAFQMATAEPYHIQWPTGVDQLLVVSVGTGNAPGQRDNLEASDLNLLDHAKTIPSALMNAATAGWDMVCRVIGECRFGGPIDSEFGAMVLPAGGAATASNWTGTKQFAYVRYDPLTTQKALDDLGLNDVRAEAMQKMDDVNLIPDLYRLGEVYAQRFLRIDHLKGFVPGESP